MALYLDQLKAQQQSTRPAPPPSVSSNKKLTDSKRAGTRILSPSQRVQHSSELDKGAGEQIVAQLEWIGKRAAEQKLLGEERIMFQDPTMLVEALTEQRQSRGEGSEGPEGHAYLEDVHRRRGEGVLEQGFEGPQEE